MRIFTTLIFTLFLAFAASAQFVLVNTPASIAGSKAFSAAGFGAALTSGIWTADVVFVNDGTANPNQGCNAATNGAALAGKIALIDRGTCEFGVKCLNAEMAGAIAVVVFNSVANAGLGTIVMGTGAVGATVTIPAVMLSYEDGQTIRTEMMTSTVNMTIGNVKFPNDLGLTSTGISNMFNGVMPANQAELIGSAITPAANVLNKGLNDASNVTLQATISFTPAGGGAASQVYDESNDVPFLDNDSTALIILPDYTPVEGEGTYAVTYNVSGSVGDSPEVTSDNSVSTSFILSDNVYCKGRWDVANNRPVTTNSYTISGGGNIEFLAGFEVPDGIGYKLDSIQFLVTTNAASLGALGANTVSAYVYDWEDGNADEIVTNDELSIIGYAPVTFADTSATSEWVKVNIYDYLELEPGGYIIPDDNKRYFVGVRYEGALLVFFGFDEGYDQTVASANFIIRDLDLPYIGINAWNSGVPDIEMGFLFTDNRSSVATALYLTPFESPSIEVTPSNVAVTLSPNPANSQLVVESKLKSATGGIAYTIRDNNGRMVYSSSKTINTDYDKASFDTSQFAAGQYFIVVTTDQGIKAERFTVQH